MSSSGTELAAAHSALRAKHFRCVEQLQHSLMEMQKAKASAAKLAAEMGRLKSNVKESSENEAIIAELQDKLLQQKAENVEMQSSMASKDDEIVQLQASHVEYKAQLAELQKSLKLQHVLLQFQNLQKHHWKLIMYYFLQLLQYCLLLMVRLFQILL